MGRRNYSDGPQQIGDAKPMTICIAAIAQDEYGPAIVTATDTRISWVDDSTEGVITKIRRINSHWFFAFASEDISTIPLVVDDFRKELDGKFTLSDVWKGSGCVHARLGNPAQWQFLVAGFDESDTPHVLSIDGSGPLLEDSIGYAAIGSGRYNAKFSLNSHPYRPRMSLPLAIYCVATAKFDAERAEGIGKQTFMSVLRPNQWYLDNSVPFMEEDIIDEIRVAWESLPTIPDGIEEHIGEFLQAKSHYAV